MPLKAKKKQNNGLRTGSSKAEKQLVLLEPPDPGMPILTPTNYREIHQNEAEALRSIYGDDFETVENKRSAWQQSAEVSFKLHLRASANPEVHVLLLVGLPATYPKTAPNLVLENLDNLRRSAESMIEDVVKNKPKTLLGSEMIYELAVSIQDILEDVAQAEAEDRDIPSLGEERIEREAAAIQQAEQQKQEERRKQEAATAEEERILQQLIEDRIRQRERTKARHSRRKSRVEGMDIDGISGSAEDSSGTLFFDPPLVIHDGEERPLMFRAVFGKTLLQRTHDKETFTVRPAVPENRASAPLLVLKEISFDEKRLDATDFRQHMRSSEDKLEALKVLRHPNLVDFIGFKIQQPLDGYDSCDNNWRVYVLFEYANKGSLSEMLDVVGNVAVGLTRAWMIQLLEALEFYHRSGFVHGNIHCGRVFLFRNLAGHVTVKLQGSVEQALPAPSGGRRSLATSESTFWLPPELLTQDGAHPTMKTDVWDLGIVFLQMGLGKDVLQRFTSANSLMSSLNLSSPLQDLLREIFRPDPKKRPTAFQLQPSEFFRVDTPLIESASASTPASLGRRPRLDSQAGMTSYSRYGQDFDEAGSLGRGGFGQVVKARNKLDGRFYALKKITQNSAAALKDTLSEIMLLSRLNHPYVVRYYTAWLEEDVGTIEEETTSLAESDSILIPDRNGYDCSTSGLDFISSSGYPRIEFGFDSDEDNEGTSSDHDVSENPKSKTNQSTEDRGLCRIRSGSQSRSVTTTLYIQMEYCEKQTLRDLIHDGLYDDIDRAWRLFRQILDGLSHIHSHGIIHRDLKPDNIFIDLANNPRIGDFGLATKGQVSTAVRSTAPTEVTDHFTRSIGTTYYVAPEVKSASTGQYNEKVDMYSLGVIFFEMCHPLKTGMERDRILQAIREKNHTLPSTFDQPEKAMQGEIIETLLSHRPSERPFAAELLQSGKIPLQVEEETFRRAILGLLSDPDSPDYKKILSEIFAQSPKKFEDIVWDIDSRGTPAANEMLVHGLVKEKLTSIFRRHGAVETNRQVLFPRSGHYSGGTVRLLDSSGNLVQLPFDLILPNARAIPRQDTSLEKTFAFGTVYRDAPHGGEPKSHKEVDFDIVSYNTLDLALKEAEAIKVLDEIVEEFPTLRSIPMCFHINHSDLLQIIMEFCRITPAQIPTVKEIISKLNVGKWTLPKIRSELRSPSVGVASTSLDDLARFDFRDIPEKAFLKLQSIMEGTEFSEKLPSIFARLNALVSYVQSFGVKRKVYINPLSSLNDKFFRGSILFQCVFDSKRRDIFAAGGRYDHLIQEFSPKVLSSRSQSHCVGFNLSLDRLGASMFEHLKKSNKIFLKHAEGEIGGGFWRTRRCDVLVSSFDATVLRTVGVKTIQELWASDISAELAVDATSLEELITRYRDGNHNWIVIAKQDSKERGLKVRNIIRKEEYDVRSAELVGWLRGEIRSRNQREGVMDYPRLLRSPSHPDAGASPNERANDVRILVSQHRSKKTNRKNIVESALLRSREVVDKALNGPIAAIDTRDDLLEAIRDTRLSDPDSWRTVIQNAPITERKYLGQVHELLCDIANESLKERPAGGGYTNAFIYNYRTGSCIYYDLGRSSEK